MLVTLGFIVGDLALEFVFLPGPVFKDVMLTNMMIPVVIIGPMSFMIGEKFRYVNALKAELEYAVNHDNLTGACTRLSFYKRLSGMQDVPLVMIVADIDFFKKINDQHGHQAGDNILKQFSNTLRRNCRENDVIARFGGEEFVILLHDITLSEGVKAANRLCTRVREANFVADGKKIHLTASFGVAALTSVTKVDDAFHKADLAVYRAKGSGRDQVCCYDPDVDDGVATQQAAE